MRVPKVRDSLRAAKAAGLAVGEVIDVGIQHSTPSLIEMFPDVHHTLFEPMDEFYPHIRRNYADLSHTLVEAAVTDTDGTLSLKSERKTRGNEISHSYLTEKQTKHTRQVKTLKLDTYFASNSSKPPYLLKIDVDGAPVPAAILRGAKQVLRDTNMVIIEMTMETFIERASILDKAGFDLWDICDLCYYGGCMWQVDAMFISRELKQKNIKFHPMHEKPFRPEIWQSGLDLNV